MLNKSKRKLKQLFFSRKINALVIILIGLILVFFVHRFTTYDNQGDLDLQSKVNLNVGEKIILRGQVIDLDTDQGLSGVSVSYHDSNVLTDDDGKFIISDVNPGDSITISGQKVYSRFEIPIEGRTELRILVDKELYDLFANIEKLEKERKYFQIHALFSDKITDKYSSDIYVRSKNKWRDDIVDSYQYTSFKMYIKKDHLTKVKSREGIENTIEATASYSWGKDGWANETYNLPVVFEKTSSGWKLSSSLLW